MASPDGTSVIAVGVDQTLREMDAVTGEVRREIRGGAPVGGRLAFSPDGTRLAVGSTRTAALWDLETGREVLTLRWHTGGIAGTAFSPDGNVLATASLDGTVRLWYAGGGGGR